MKICGTVPSRNLTLTASVYEYTDGYVGESDIRLYLENGDDDFGYIDITYKTLEEYFERID